MGNGIPGGMALILACAAVTYLTRITGFALVGKEIPPFFDRFLRMVPVAAFAALTAPDLVHGTSPPARIVAAIACAALIVRTRKLWLGLLAGMAVFAALRVAGL
ncbi:MAG: AzlD domain-containing protein [Thermomicrobiales bacterium]